MAVELAEVAAGLPVAASFAVAGGITTLREGRRRAALNEAMHELRRPLQVLSLAVPAELPAAAPVESSLQLATVALERLDREINGASLEEVATDVFVGELIEVAQRRWCNAAALSGRSIELDCNGEVAVIEGDRFELTQALDNLLSNAIEHGSGTVGIRCTCQGEWVSITVADAGARSEARGRSHRRRRDGRSRRGHGLRVVSRIARRHGGSFALKRTSRGTEAMLRLPLCRQEPRR
jgi:signal transduction histidine kinase